MSPPTSKEGAAPLAIASTQVIVCTRDRPFELRRCLASIRAAAPTVGIIVVDSSPQAAPAADSAAEFRADYVRVALPGLSRARNVGMRHATAEILAFIDDDASAEPGWLEALIREFKAAEVGVVMGPCHAESGTDDSLRLAAEARWITRAERVVLLPRQRECLAFAIEGQLGTGSNLAVRRETLSRWSGFDEQLGRGAAIAGAEEHAAVFELLMLGYNAVYTPDAIVRHPAPATTEALELQLAQARADTVAFLLWMTWRHSAARRTIRRIIWRKLRAWTRGVEEVSVPTPAIGWRESVDTLRVGLAKFLRTVRTTP